MFSKFIERLLTEMLTEITTEPVLIIDGKAWKVMSWEIANDCTGIGIYPRVKAVGVQVHHAHRS